MSAKENEFGEFLRARRALLEPKDVGLPEFGRRRVPGLRRDEVAMLAGVSTHYYARLEQGRDRRPSLQVTQAVGKALGLDHDGLVHLLTLAEPGPPPRRRPSKPPRARPGVRRLLAAWDAQPALVMGSLGEVVVANPLATALCPAFREGENLMRFVFLDPAAEEYYGDWATVAAESVSVLRASMGRDLHDPRLAALIGELSVHSTEFRSLWSRHDVRQKTAGVKAFQNPLVGPLVLDYETFAVNSAEGQTLIVYFGQAGSPDEQALRLLATLVTNSPSADSTPTGPVPATPARQGLEETT